MEDKGDETDTVMEDISVTVEKKKVGRPPKNKTLEVERVAEVDLGGGGEKGGRPKGSKTVKVVPPLCASKTRSSTPFEEQSRPVSKKARTSSATTKLVEAGSSTRPKDKYYLRLFSGKITLIKRS